MTKLFGITDAKLHRLGRFFKVLWPLVQVFVSATDKPPYADEDGESARNDRGVVHVLGAQRHHEREAEEHNRDENVHHRGNVDGPAPLSEVEGPGDDGLAARENVRQDGARVRHGRKHNVRGDERREGGRRADIDAAQAAGDARDRDGRTERRAKRGRNLAEKGGAGRGLVAGERPEGSAAGRQGADQGGECCEEEDGREPDRALGYPVACK